MDKKTLLREISKLIDQYECDEDGYITNMVDCNILFLNEDETWVYTGTEFEKE